MSNLKKLCLISLKESNKYNITGLIRCLKFVEAALINTKSFSKLSAKNPSSLLGRTVADRPEVLLFIRAPYFCADWNADQRISEFVSHINSIEMAGSPFDFSINECIQLIDLPFDGDYHVRLDKPKWFHREGVVTINIFRENKRLFSLSFSLKYQDNHKIAFIGGVQGRHLPGILDEYKKLTKLSEGIRPRDLLIEIFRMLCGAIKIEKIMAIADDSRHHRSDYFGVDKSRQLPLDYDEIWLDRGGVLFDSNFYLLPIRRQEREEVTIPTNKRAMYRRRKELLDRLESLVISGINNAHPVHSSEAE